MLQLTDLHGHAPPGVPFDTFVSYVLWVWRGQSYCPEHPRALPVPPCPLPDNRDLTICAGAFSRITKDAASSGWCLSLGNLHLSYCHIFSGLGEAIFVRRIQTSAEARVSGRSWRQSPALQG